jgi:hypothetical protein
MLQLLADAAARAPTSGKVDPDSLTPLAYALAQRVYPHLLRPAINAMPMWVTWLAAFPRFSRRRLRLLESLHRSKMNIVFLGTLAIPFILIILNMVLLINRRHFPTLQDTILLLTVIFAPLLAIGSEVLFLFSLLVSGRLRRLARWRKRLAALLSVRYDLAPGGLSALMEDDDLYTLLLQRFLADHQAPYTLPLYDVDGRYLFKAPEKIPVLASALLQAVGRGRDNELFVLLADLLELDEDPEDASQGVRPGGTLGPLLRAVRVALSRHHQVIVVCPWPPGLALPRDEAPTAATPTSLRAILGRATTERFHAAYQRLRRTFARMGVHMVCAASEEPIPLILDRIEQLRTMRRAR